MKNSIIALLLIIGLSAFAQEKKDMGKRHQRSEMEKFTPEQRNQLMVKKMTLELELNSKQQEQVGKIIAEQGKILEARKAERMAMKNTTKKPTTDEHFAMKMKMLDEQIVMQAKIKSVLSPEQFKDWKNLKAENRERFHKKRSEHRGKEEQRG